MRRIMITAAAVALGTGLAACGSSSSGSGASSAASGTPSAAASCSNAAIQKDLFTKGVLTVGTDKPVYPPWFENNDPANGKGY
jgi:polar amino acid transport system substrate-binding protein